MSFRKIRETTDWRESQVLRNPGSVEASQTALLSQEGSVIAFFAMTRGVVPQTKCFRMHS